MHLDFFFISSSDIIETVPEKLKYQNVRNFSHFCTTKGTLYILVPLESSITQTQCTYRLKYSGSTAVWDNILGPVQNCRDPGSVESQARSGRSESSIQQWQGIAKYFNINRRISLRTEKRNLAISGSSKCCLKWIRPVPIQKSNCWIIEKRRLWRPDLVCWLASGKH